jgi:hypothetical protein
LVSEFRRKIQCEPDYLWFNICGRDSILFCFAYVADQTPAEREANCSPGVTYFFFFRFSIFVPDHRREKHPGMGLCVYWNNLGVWHCVNLEEDQGQDKKNPKTTMTRPEGGKLKAWSACLSGRCLNF